MKSYKKKIFIFSSVHPWNDTRVFYKMAVSLATQYQVELHAPAAFTYKKIKNVHIYGLPKWNMKLDRLKAHYLLIRRISNSNADIFHFHDPELLYLGLYIKVILKKKVIYDVHEDYPKQISEAVWLIKPFGLIVGCTIGVFESMLNHILDQYIVVTKPIYNRFKSKRTTIVYNYPFRCKDRNDKNANEIHFIYIGNLREDRGIKMLCLAFNKLLLETHNLNLRLIVGGKLSGSKAFNEEMLEIFKSQNIDYKGLVPYSEALSLMESAHIGIIPSHYKKNYFEALPNKLFEYMQNELMLITTNIPLWENIVLKNKIGYTFQGESINSLFKTMKRSIKSKNEIATNAKRARNLSLLKYNWETEEKKLFELYKQILEL